MITSDFHLSKSSSIMKKSNSTSSTTSSTTSSSICPNKVVMCKNILQNQASPMDISGDSISPPKKKYFSKFWPFRKFVHSTECEKNQCLVAANEKRVHLLPNISTKIPVSKPEMVAKDQIHQRQLSIIKEDEIWEGKSHQEDDSSAAPPFIDAQKMREMKNAGKICDISIIKDDIRNIRKLNNRQIEYIKNLNKDEKDEIIQEYNRSYESMIDAIKVFLEVRSKPNSTNVSRSPSFQKVHRLSPELRFDAKSRDSGEIGSS